jgi:hypothetical protein
LQSCSDFFEQRLIQTVYWEASPEQAVQDGLITFLSKHGYRKILDGTMIGYTLATD